jgi:hypothetical protein
VVRQSSEANRLDWVRSTDQKSQFCTAQTIEINSAMANSFVQRFEQCFTELNSTRNMMLVVVRGHLYCESALGELLRQNLQHPEEIPIDRLEFQAKVNLCAGLGLFDLTLKPALTQLGKLRNKYVHQLDYELTENDQIDLTNSLKSTIGLPAEYYLRKGMTFPEGVRRCVMALWVPLEIRCIPKGETKEALEHLAKMLASSLGISDEEFREFCRSRLEKFFKERGEPNAI